MVRINRGEGRDYMVVRSVRVSRSPDPQTRMGQGWFDERSCQNVI